MKALENEVKGYYPAIAHSRVIVDIVNFHIIKYLHKLIDNLEFIKLRMVLMEKTNLVITSSNVSAFQPTHIDQIPENLLLYVFSFLSPNETNLNLVSKKWKLLSEELAQLKEFSSDSTMPEAPCFTPAHEESYPSHLLGLDVELQAIIFTDLPLEAFKSVALVNKALHAVATDDYTRNLWIFQKTGDNVFAKTDRNRLGLPDLMYLIKLAIQGECRELPQVKAHLLEKLASTPFKGLFQMFIDQYIPGKSYPVSCSTLLDCSCAAGQIELVKLLVEKRVQSPSALMKAAEEGHLEIVKFLVSCGMGNQNYALWVAAKQGRLEIVKFLVEAGAKDKEALTEAALYGHLNVVQYLAAQQDVDINARDHSEDTALHNALSKGHTEVVKYLIEHGADIDAKTQSLNTPLHLAARFGLHEIAKILLEKGAKINEKNVCNDLPIHEAVRQKHFKMVKLLTIHGADLTATCWLPNIRAYGTPMEAARGYGYHDIANYLE